MTQQCAVSTKTETKPEKRSIRIPQRLLFAIYLLVAVSTVGIVVRYLPDLDWIAQREDMLRSKITSHPITCYVLGLVVYTGLSLIPGTAGKSIVFGWLFGFVAALLMVELGLTAAAVLSFLVGRFLVRHLLHRRWQIYLRWLNKKFARDGAFYLIWLRLAHVPFTLVNYGAGATNIPLTTFWWTTHLGVLPATVIYTFIGSRIPNIRDVAAKGLWALVDPWLVVVLVVIAILPALFRFWFPRVQH